MAVADTVIANATRKERVDALVELAREWLPPASGNAAGEPLFPAYEALIDQNGLGSTAVRAIPVESLYEPWTTDPAARSPFAHKTGYLHGDAQAHISDLLGFMGARVPQSIDIEADHLAVLLDLAGAFAAFAGAQAQTTFANDHLAWFDAYAERARKLWSHDDPTGRANKADRAHYLDLLDRTAAAIEELRTRPAEGSALTVYSGFLKAESSDPETLSRELDAAPSLESWRARAFSSPEVAATTACGGCINGCAMRVITKNGRILRVEGVKEDPVGQGSLCAKGANYVDIAYTPTGRVTAPAKRQSDGTYRYITWDQAVNEIAEKLHEIVRKHGAASIAENQGVSAYHTLHSSRFFTALGTPNSFTTVTGACKPSLDLAWNLTAGAWPQLDFAHADYVVFIGRSYADGIVPPLLRGIKALHGNESTHYVVVDPRRNATVDYADEWLAIKPGTDLAFILALSHVVVEEGLYDEEFIREHTTGFGTYAAALAPYTPEWAERVTDIPAATIHRIARDLAHANHGAIEQGFRGGLGNSYRNNIQTVRALALFNGLIGAYGKEGALNFAPQAPSAGIGALDPDRFPAPAPVEGGIYDFQSYPHLNFDDVTAQLLLGAARGDIRALFYYATNPVLAHGNPEWVREQLSNLDLLVDIDIRWSETAGAADYVLPDVTFLEQDRAIKVAGGIAYDQPATIEPVHARTLPSWRIFQLLAEAYGVGGYVAFAPQDEREAQLRDLGLQSEAFANGTVAKLEEPSSAASAPEPVHFAFPNETGKLAFASSEFESMGHGLVPHWEAPLLEPHDGEFRLVSGNFDLYAHTYSTLSPAIVRLTKKLGYDRVWINTEKAAKLGINEGDEIELVSKNPLVQRTVRARAHVTDGIHASTLFASSNLGARQPELGEAVGLGVAYLDFAPNVFDRDSLSTLSQENAIEVRKVS